MVENEFTEKRGPGRPKMEDESKRDRVLRIRFTQFEKQKIATEARKMGISVSQYIREKTL